MPEFFEIKKRVARGILLLLLFFFCTAVKSENNYSCYIGVNTSESVNSYVNNVRHLGSQILLCEKIDSLFLVFDDSNFDDELKYIVDSLLRPSDFQVSWKIIVDHNLYIKLNPSNGLSTYTLFNGGTFGSIKLCKLDNFVCPQSLFLKKIILNRHEIKLNDLNTIFPYFDSDSLFLLISDIDNSLYLVNSNTGNKVKKFSSSTLSGAEIYCKMFDIDSAACQFAKLGEVQLKKAGRARTPFYKVRCHNGKVYIGSGLQVQTILEKDFIYKDDRFEEQIIEKGSPFFWQYSILIELDSQLNLNKVYKIDEETIPVKIRDNYLAGIDYGFNITSENKLVTYSTPNKRTNISTVDPVLSFYGLDKDTFKYLNGSELSFPNEFEKREYWCYNIYVESYKGDIIFNLPTYNKYSRIRTSDGKTINENLINQNFIDSSFNQLSQFVQDDNEENLNFFVLDVLYNGELKFLYRMNGEVYFRKSNKHYCVSDLDGFPSVDLSEFDEGNCSITKDKILWINKEKSGYILYKISY
ncbi:MAG: hypothetical protein ACI80H_000539 [Pseudoalteromonas distincta]|jgi:hypothetical protein